MLMAQLAGCGALSVHSQGRRDGDGGGQPRGSPSLPREIGKRTIVSLATSSPVLGLQPETADRCTAQLLELNRAGI
jgi:hypothetical protein